MVGNGFGKLLGVTQVKELLNPKVHQIRKYSCKQHIRIHTMNTAILTHTKMHIWKMCI